MQGAFSILKLENLLAFELEIGVIEFLSCNA